MEGTSPVRKQSTELVGSQHGSPTPSLGRRIYGNIYLNNGGDDLSPSLSDKGSKDLESDIQTRTMDMRARRTNDIKKLGIALRYELTKNHITMDANSIIP